MRLVLNGWRNVSQTMARITFEQASINARAAMQQSSEISRAVESQGQGITDAQAMKFVQLLKEARAEAALVRRAVLAKACPGMSEAFDQKYVRGLDRFLEYTLSGKDDPKAWMSAVNLFGEWKTWWSANEKNLRFPEDVPE